MRTLQRTCCQLAAQVALWGLAGNSRPLQALLQNSKLRYIPPPCSQGGNLPSLLPTFKLVPRLTVACAVLQAASIIPADSNSLAYLRTVAEVTNIVSGFFPKGLSGL